MKELNDPDLEFVARHYETQRFDTRAARARFHARTSQTTIRRRWWTTAAAAAASVALLFAAGYGIRSWLREETVPAAHDQPALQQETGQHVFVFENTPVDQVLSELSDHYGCTLTTPPTDKCLTATFPEEDLVTIIPLIDAALDISITVQR